MKIYLASRYSRHDEMRGVRDVLAAMGHEVTSRWIDCHTDVMGDHTASFTSEVLNASPELCAPLGEHDLDDLMAADLVASFTCGTGGKGGRHVEYGFALALGKDLVVVGPRENVFHTLIQVRHYPTWGAWVIDLQRQARMTDALRTASAAVLQVEPSCHPGCSRTDAHTPWDCDTAPALRPFTVLSGWRLGS